MNSEEFNTYLKSLLKQKASKYGHSDRNETNLPVHKCLYYVALPPARVVQNKGYIKANYVFNRKGTFSRNIKEKLKKLTRTER